MSGNRIDSLPESFSSLTSLEKLDLGSALFKPVRSNSFRNGNNIYTLPKEFGFYFESMTELRLDECSIFKLPDGFGRSMAKLKILDLHGNALTQLPDSFCQMISLETLTISLNGLKTLPPNFGNLNSLKKCYLSSNFVSSFSGNFESIALTPLSSHSWLSCQWVCRAYTTSKSWISTTMPSQSFLESLLPFLCSEERISEYPLVLQHLQTLISFSKTKILSIMHTNIHHGCICFYKFLLHRLQPLVFRGILLRK